ncbi:MAG: flagellar hook-associated protein FlgK, partial [Nitrospinota bacterium]|nr:flagellar hook-associated protein FlgK [Nitrospinota bacterium]
VLNTAKLGLQTNQTAIEVVGHNIANVQTEGFSRQEVTLEVNRPRRVGLAFLGTGVRATSVTRNFDQFLFNQILSESSTLGNFDIRNTFFQRLETIVNESSGVSLNNAMSEFFLAFDDLASNPTNLGARTAVLSAAGTLAAVFNQLGSSLHQQRINLDGSIAAEVTDINGMLDEIAKLNRSIIQLENGNTPANDLLDQRDLLVKQLSEKLDVQLIDTNDSKTMLTLSGGSPLVVGTTVFHLSTAANLDNRGFKDVLVDDGMGGTNNVTAEIQGGEMRGFLDMRDVETLGLIDQLDRLAAGLMEQVNGVHQQGVGLDGSSGNLFFETLTPTVTIGSQNLGTPTVTAVNASPSTVTVDKYQLQFTSPVNFDVFNLTTNQTVATGLVVGGTVNIANGLSITTGGLPVIGDTVNISISEDAALKMALSSTVLNDTSKIAAGLSGTGDGQNALNISNLQNSLVFSAGGFTPGAGTSTFDDFYNSMVGGLGAGSRSSQTILSQQEGVMLQLNSQRESISGVSLDEEMVNLIKFQQAYAASARMITVIEEMFDVLQRI